MNRELLNLSLLLCALAKVLLYTGVGPGIALMVIAESKPVRLYVFRWAKYLGMPVLGGTRKGQFCKVLVRGGRNSCLVEFPDGLQVVTSRNALRKSS
ncbi:MAG TPA: hypothetical protein VGM18_05045 [Candidatus Sulfotelmatobacter sp.]|jgi:hypothetical protein